MPVKVGLQADELVWNASPTVLGALQGFPTFVFPAPLPPDGDVSVLMMHFEQELEVAGVDPSVVEFYYLTDSVPIRQGQTLLAILQRQKSHMN